MTLSNIKWNSLTFIRHIVCLSIGSSSWDMSFSFVPSPVKHPVKGSKSLKFDVFMIILTEQEIFLHLWPLSCLNIFQLYKKLVWANILKFWTMCSLLGTPHVRAHPPRGPKMPQNSENDYIRGFALLTQKFFFMKQFF